MTGFKYGMLCQDFTMLSVQQQEDRLEPQTTAFAALLGNIHLLCFVYKHHRTGIKALFGKAKQQEP